MWLICLRLDGRKPPRGPAHIAGHVSEWVPVRLAGDAAPHAGAHVPDDAPKANDVRLKAVHMHAHCIAEDDQVEVLAARSAKPEAPGQDEDDARSVVANLQALALRQGWGLEDLLGTAENGDPTAAGGRSPRCGLTLAEITLCRPPADWEELQAKGKAPWHSADWTPPVPGWAPPAWADTEPEAPPSDPSPILPEADQVEAVSTPEAPAEAEPEAPAEAAPEADKADEPVDTYPVEHYEEAKALVVDLYQQGGKVPHHAAVNYALTKRHDPPLPSITKAQIAEMIGTTS